MTLSDSYSWAQFQLTYGTMFNPRELALAKIAARDETQDISLYAEGGGPGAIYGQTLKILFDNAAADSTPNTVSRVQHVLHLPERAVLPGAPGTPGLTASRSRA